MPLKETTAPCASPRNLPVSMVTVGAAAGVSAAISGAAALAIAAAPAMTATPEASHANSNTPPARSILVLMSSYAVLSDMPGECPQRRVGFVGHGQSCRNARPCPHTLDPFDQTRRAFLDSHLGKQPLHGDRAMREEIDIGEGVHLTRKPRSLRQLLLHFVDRDFDFSGRVRQVAGAEARAGGAPFLPLLVQRNTGHQLLELAAFDGARDNADHAMPTVHRDIVHHVLIDKLVPETHARLTDGIGRAQGWTCGESILEVFVDHGRLGDDDTVVIENGHLPLRIDPDKPRLVLLELVQIDVDAFELQPLFLQWDQALE